MRLRSEKRAEGLDLPPRSRESIRFASDQILSLLLSCHNWHILPGAIDALVQAVLDDLPNEPTPTPLAAMPVLA